MSAMLDDITNGKNDGYSVKEILTEFIKEQREFNKRTTNLLEKGMRIYQTKHQCNLIRSSIQKMYLFMFSLGMTLLGALAYYVIYGMR